MTKDSIVSQIVILTQEQHKRLYNADLNNRAALIIEMCSLAWLPEQLISAVEEPSDCLNKHYYTLTIDKNAIVKHPYEIGSVVMTISEHKSFSWTDGLKVVMGYNDDGSIALGKLDSIGRLQRYRHESKTEDDLRKTLDAFKDSKWQDVNVFNTSPSNPSIKKTNLTYNLSADGF